MRAAALLITVQFVLASVLPYHVVAELMRLPALIVHALEHAHHGDDLLHTLAEHGSGRTHHTDDAHEELPFGSDRHLMGTPLLMCAAPVLCKVFTTHQAEASYVHAPERSLSRTLGPPTGIFRPPKG